MQINFFSLIHTIQLALPHLRKAKGTVVLVSSGAAESERHDFAAQPLVSVTLTTCVVDHRG